MWHSNSPLRIESAGCLGITWVAGVLLFTLFREDQFSGIRLAQQVELAVMLDNHPPFNAEQRFAVNAAIGGGGGRCCVFFYWRCRAVIRT
ncbi:hypothetical protein ENTCAN_05797 [Enterobacter cancerogenus ATCC 35316]|nr:hypothetical protein ENTCAN_05797 [Enterobacter cancerogenus ATCC 35316]